MAKLPKRPPPQVTGHHFVKEWREYRGLTQEQLAERIKRSRPLITQFEKGTTGLTQGTIYALEDALDCPPGGLFRIDPSKEGVIVDIIDELRKADAETQAEALGYIRGRIAAPKR